MTIPLRSFPLLALGLAAACSNPDSPNDPCALVTCSSHGTCEPGAGSATCRCDPGFAGPTCAACAAGFVTVGKACLPGPTNPCDPNPCREEHRTACTAQAGAPVCSCDTGFYDNGGSCEAESAGPCSPNPCREASRRRCSADGATAVCSCDLGHDEVGGDCVPLCDAGETLCTAAEPSANALVSANGHGALVYDVAMRKAVHLFEHPYRNFDDGVWSHDLLYDTMLGVRIGDTGTWLNSLAPVHEEHLQESGIIHTVHRTAGLRIDTYFYVPQKLSRPAVVLLGKLTNEGSESVPASLYTLHNYHLGSVSGTDPKELDAQGERTQHQSESGAYLESGPAGFLLHQPLGAVDHHGCTPDNPWQALQDGDALADTADSGVGEDRVAGFERELELEPGASGWIGVCSAFDADDAAALAADVDALYGGVSDPGELLEQELAAWENWRVPPPPGLSAAERSLYRQSEAILRQAQVRESSDLSYGQILASLPPGGWNISWPRDMAYAVQALVDMGHLEEARAALEFVLHAESGRYESYVGLPYQVSITRYFGRGKEETDFNDDGPNIEYDGFGLFLWTMASYVSAARDATLVEAHWPAVRDEIAGALLGLIDPATGMVSADSSIWEVHWNGKQKRYTYTSLAAAHGLCAAKTLAEVAGDEESAALYESACSAITEAVASHVIDGAHVLASSYEELLSGFGYRDAAVVEAFNWRLFNPAGATSSATLAALDSYLRVPTGRGLCRNDDGGPYDLQEWVFIDLRVSMAKRAAGRVAEADALLDWVSAASLANHGIIAELYDKEDSSYDGAFPMVGFGAGAYVLALLDRERSY